jgi:hypothetical protein
MLLGKTPCQCTLMKVGLRKHNRSFDLTSDAIGYAQFYDRSTTVIRLYDAAGNVIETHKHKGEFQGWSARSEAKTRQRGKA